MRHFRVAGGLNAHRERLAELGSEPTRPQRPANLPPPELSHYARLARDKRREAASIARHLLPNDESQAARFARRQIRELLDQADAYEAQSQGGA